MQNAMWVMSEFFEVSPPDTVTAAWPAAPEVSPGMLAAVGDGLPVPVAVGRHKVAGDQACLMELASALAREPWSDHPACVHPVLAAVARAVNDRIGDDARQFLAPLVPLMIGTAGSGPDDRERLERCARLVLLCTRTALEAGPFLAGEMESARRSALGVLSVLGRPAAQDTGPPGRAARWPVTPRTVAALLDRLGALGRMYPRRAAIQAAQAVSVIAGTAAPARDERLSDLLRACTARCAPGMGEPGMGEPGTGPGRRDANVQDLSGASP
jgi:hypothetical protein